VVYEAGGMVACSRTLWCLRSRSIEEEVISVVFRKLDAEVAGAALRKRADVIVFGPPREVSGASR
jgi:hypothetical protein